MDEAENVWDEYIKKYPNYLDAYVQKGLIIHDNLIQLIYYIRCLRQTKLLLFMMNIFKEIKVISKLINLKVIYLIKMLAEFLVSLNLYDDAIEVWDKYL